MILQTKKLTRIYEDIQWMVIVIKDKYEQKAEGYDGYYEFWLNNKDYGHTMHVFSMELKNWKEAEDYVFDCIKPPYKRDYIYELEKLEADNLYRRSNSCPLVDTIIPYMMKGVNNGETKSNAEIQGQKGLYTDRKQYQKS